MGANLQTSTKRLSIGDFWHHKLWFEGGGLHLGELSLEFYLLLQKNNKGNHAVHFPGQFRFLRNCPPTPPIPTFHPKWEVGVNELREGWVGSFPETLMGFYCPKTSWSKVMLTRCLVPSVGSLSESCVFVVEFAEVTWCWVNCLPKPYPEK